MIHRLGLGIGECAIEVTGYPHMLQTQQLSSHLMWWQCNMRPVSASWWLALKTETSVSLSLLSDERTSIASSNC